MCGLLCWVGMTLVRRGTEAPSKPQEVASLLTGPSGSLPPMLGQPGVPEPVGGPWAAVFGSLPLTTHQPLATLASHASPGPRVGGQ